MDKGDEAKQKIIDYIETFGTARGKRVLADLIKESGYERYGKPKKGLDGHTDVYLEMFNKGCHYMVARIIVFINKDPNEKKGIKHD